MINFSDPSAFILENKSKYINKFKKIINSKNYIKGSELELFEKKFAVYNKSKYSIGVANGTDALELAINSLNIERGSEVITVSHTSPATITAIINSGLKPVMLDIGENSYNINTKIIEKYINTKTKLILAVHLYGLPANILEIQKIAKKNNLYLIEDCSQAHGAMFKNKKVGNFGNMGCFSFYPTKNLGSIGDAGAITTNNKLLYQKLLKLREYGWDKNKQSIYIGKNSRLDEIQSGFLNINLQFLNKNNKKRNLIADNYFKKLNSKFYQLPNYDKNKFYNVFHLFVIQTKYRSKLIDYMKKNNVNLGIHYKLPCHKHLAFKKLSTKKINLLNTEKISNKIVSLPLYPGLTIKSQKKIISYLNKFAKIYE